MNITLNTILNPNDEVIVFATYFGEYDNYIIEPRYPYLDEIYVSLYPQYDAAVTISARTYPDTYSASKASITLVEGNFYTSHIALTKD